MSDPLLEVEDLTVRYQTDEGPLTAVSNVSFSIDEGNYFGLVGESGCGKSTIAKAVLGALDDNGQVTSGEIRLNGNEIQDLTEKQLNQEVRWKEISLIPQGSMNNLDPLQRVGDQAVEIAQTHTELSKNEALEQFKSLFSTVGLQEERVMEYPHQFSGGMQQRAIIALALFLKPSLIIADEPTTALDVIMQDQIFNHLEELRDEFETSLMLITHDISLVFEACDRIGVMHGGQLAESGDVMEVYESPRHPYSILLQNAFPDIRDTSHDLVSIPGTPPQNFGDIDQCTFVDRCPWAKEECKQSAPDIETVAPDSEQVASCFRKDEVHRLVDESGLPKKVVQQGDD